MYLGQTTSMSIKERIKALEEKLKLIREKASKMLPALTPEQRERVKKVAETVKKAVPEKVEVKNLLPLMLMGGFLYTISKKPEKPIRRR